MIKIGDDVFIEMKSANFEYAINRQGIIINSTTHKIIPAYSDELHTGYPSCRVWIKGWHKMVTLKPHQEVVKYFDPPNFVGYVVHHVYGKWRTDRDALVALTPKEHRKVHKAIDERELNNPCLCFSVIDERYLREYENWFEASTNLKLGLKALQLLRKSRKKEMIAGMFLEPMPRVTITKVRRNNEHLK